VVVVEIESWYLAGVSNERLNWLGFNKSDTNDVTKEHFLRLKPRANTRVEFMIENLQDYELKRATTRNRSLAYFVSKWT
jgi:hypothetical protein